MQANAVEGYHTAFMLCPYRAPVGTFIMDVRLIGIRGPVAPEYGTASERLFRARALPTSVTISGEGAEAANFRLLRGALYVVRREMNHPKVKSQSVKSKKSNFNARAQISCIFFCKTPSHLEVSRQRVGVQHIDVGVQPRSELPCCLSLVTSKEVHELPARDGFGTDIRLR